MRWGRGRAGAGRGWGGKGKHAVLDAIDDDDEVDILALEVCMKI